jgi:two-component system, OmpR family, response regulator
MNHRTREKLSNGGTVGWFRHFWIERSLRAVLLTRNWNRLAEVIVHILVVDDDAAIRDLISGYLEREDFQVSAVADGKAMARVLAEKTTDLIILDLKLSGEDGIALMRARSDADIPVVLVTGHRRDEADRIIGLELGADDYVTKPFSPRELLARVRAVLRRIETAHRRSREKEKRARYCFAGWELEMRARRLKSPSGEVVPLTAGEFNLLATFLQSPYHVLSREQLLAASRVHDEEVFDRSIDVQILRLRRKLEANPSEPTLIKTERGTGYVLDTEVDVL